MTVQTLSEAAAPAGASARAWRGAHHGAQHLALGVLRRLLPWVLPLALLALWQVGAATGWIASRVLPAPLVQAGVQLDTVLLTLAMAALGLTTHIAAVRAAGTKPLLLALVLFGWLLGAGLLLNLWLPQWF